MAMPAQDSVDVASSEGQRTSRAKPEVLPRESADAPLPTEVNKSISLAQESILEDGEVTTRAAAQKERLESQTQQSDTLTQKQ